MIKTKKAGVTHKGKILRAGALLSLPEADEKRLVKEGWASFVESWPAGKEEEKPDKDPQTDPPKDEEKPDEGTAETDEEEQADEGPQTDPPENEEPPKRTRGRKK